MALCHSCGVPLAWSSSSTPLIRPSGNNPIEDGWYLVDAWLSAHPSAHSRHRSHGFTCHKSATSRRRIMHSPSPTNRSRLGHVAFRGSLTQHPKSSLPHGFARLLSNLRLATEVREDHHRRKVRSPKLVELPVAINAQLQKIHALVHERVGDFVAHLGARLLR